MSWHKKLFTQEKSLLKLAELEAEVYQAVVVHGHLELGYQIGANSKKEAVMSGKKINKLIQKFSDMCREFDPEGGEGLFVEALERIRIRGEAEGTFTIFVEQEDEECDHPECDLIDDSR